MSMSKMIDLHCHILPYVDDGASDLEEALYILREQQRQGVEMLCLTPHCRQGMFETPDEEIIRQYERLCKLWTEQGEKMKLFLSREYHWDGATREKVKKREILRMGSRRGILLEFSNRHSVWDMQEAIRFVRMEGYQPLIAHVERYGALSYKTEQAERLYRCGARLQVNAGSILGHEGMKQKRFAMELLKTGMIYAVASDTHDTEVRPTKLKECRDFCVRKLGGAATDKLFYQEPLNILGIKETKHEQSCYRTQRASVWSTGGAQASAY